MKTTLLVLSLATVAGVAPAQTARPEPPVTRQQAIARAEAMFARQDLNRDGKVTPEERRAAMAAMRAGRGNDMPPPGGRGTGRGPMANGDLTLEDARARAGARFDRLDTNRDGRLDAAELAARPRGSGRGFGGDDTPPPAD